MEMMESAMNSGAMRDGEPGEEEPKPEDEPGGGVDWRGICRSYVELERNWLGGKTMESWITPMHNAVWRFKVNEEQQVMYNTNRYGESGLTFPSEWIVPWLQKVS